MRILIVDDEPMVAETLTLVFRRNGYDAVKANDADQALLLARQIQPDLVLCDIDMPGRDGIALMGDLTRELPTAPSSFSQASTARSPASVPSPAP